MSLKDIQRSLKAKYRREDEAAKLTLTVHASQLSADAMSCSVDRGRAVYKAQAHSGVGGSGVSPCSGDLLLGALAACTQLTTQMVAEAVGITVDHSDVTVEGDLDLRGTLGIDSSVPVGFQQVRATVQVRADATDRQREMPKEMTERYCVVMSTLRIPPELSVAWDVSAPT